MFKHLRTLAITGAAALPLAIAAIPAHAGTSAGTFSVTATVVNSCVINSAGNLAFGNYDPNSATPTTGSSSIKVNCTKGDAYTIALNYGANGGSATNRIMVSGTNQLDYNLYTDTGYSNVWLATCPSPVGTSCDGGTGAGPGAGNAQTYTVYGSIAIGQNVPAGSYSDTIQVTVTF
ncbi:MAG: Csu type fimbrial protein [Gammaproteobacteria bacterium]